VVRLLSSKKRKSIKQVVEMLNSGLKNNRFNLISRKAFSFVVFLLFIFTLPVIAFSQDGEEQVVVTGMADGTTAKARDEAVDDALRSAVEQAMGSYVSSETLVENMILIEDRIYSETRGYIKSYEVLKEKTDGGAYQVKISAVVKTGKLAGDLESIGLLIRKKRNPRVMVVLSSRMVSGTYFEVSREGNRNVESLVESKLIQKGFQVVDAGQVNHKKKVEAAIYGNELSKAGKIAKDFGAEVLVVGDVRREYTNSRILYGRHVRFFSNEIRFKALETDTAKVLYSGFRTKPPSGVDFLEPMQEASSELVEEMISGILGQWSKDVYQIATYELSLSDASFKDVSQLKKSLKDIRGFGGVQTRTFQSGIAFLEVKYKGTIEELAEKISELSAPALEIVGMQSNTIDMKVSK
jgi:hypothetical protein